MSRANGGLVIGAGVGLFTAVTNPAYTPTAIVVMMMVCALIGWGIGRYMEMRKPRR